ncbi:glycosyltransferase family 4 protein [Anditalea andensis]|uniref:Glycosyl transferase family 1 n=1 Tax=Anditalea andensis TaxID=1048983 RepID=A0A074KXC8_9BACT|nr:glycosyltransferase family 4 protein [Anditalea andensis]KEO74606.1 hypothetical protein EL17_02725 [Anditalea andensis]
MKKILFLPKYTRLGASSRLRTFQYLNFWEKHGYEVTVSSFFNDDYLSAIYKNNSPDYYNVVKCYCRRLWTLVNALKYDIIYIEKEIFPYLPAYAELLLKFCNKGYIVDYDDAIFHNYDCHKLRIVKYILGDKIDIVMRHAKMVWVGNSYLYQRTIRAGAKETLVLPTVVDLHKYAMKVPKSKTSLPVIGWIGTPLTVKYLHNLLPSLEKLYDMMKFTIMVIGPETSLDFKGEWECLPWSEENEISYLHFFDVGIMPLPDSDWEQGKCAYKLIQYMACGLPIVASPVGMNTDVVRHGINGFLAASEEDWIFYLSMLIRDHDLCIKMGVQGRKLVESSFNLNKNWERMHQRLLDFS